VKESGNGVNTFSD